MEQSPLSIALKPGWRLVTAVVASHLSLAAISFSMPHGWSTVVQLLVAVSMLRAAVMHLWPGSALRVNYLRWSPQAGWSLGLVSGHEHPARLLGESFVHPRLTILNFATGQLAWRSVVLMEGSVQPTAFRRLRVLLASQRQGGTSLS